MTDKDLRHLSRTDLIEIIFELQKRERQLLEKLDAVQAQLDAKTIKISEAGSIAEAVVGLNRIFETAQETADEYLAQIRFMQADAEAKCADMIEKARRASEQLMLQAEKGNTEE